jgi:UDPglucose 6-dehydrogenase
MAEPEFDVAAVGLWHLGSVSVAGWTRVGLRVVAWDPDEALRSSVTVGRAAVAEPGVDDSLAEALGRGALEVADAVEGAVGAAAVTHLVFDTQVDERNRSDDPRLDAAVAAFASAAPDGALLVVSSQVPVGTSQRWRSLLDSRRRGLLLAHVPENLRLGAALDGFLAPPRLLIGADDDDAYERTAALFAPVGTSPRRLRLASAEMAKHATNAYLALCIAFANDVAWVSRHVGADPLEVIDALRADPRVSPTAPLRPGPAFSGATLIRDVTTLTLVGEECGRSTLFSAIAQANELHSHASVSLLEEALGELDGKRIALLGLTYKAGTSTLRDSLPLRVAQELLGRGAMVAAWDPLAEQFEPPRGLTRHATIDAAVRDADAVCVITPLPEVAVLDWTTLAPAQRVVVDGGAAVDSERVQASGWTYLGL